MERFLVAVECAIEFDDKFLFIRRPKGVHAEGLLSFPGGKVEYDDGAGNQSILIQALKREVLEEVGLNLKDPIHFLTSSYFVDNKGTHVLDVIFHCKLKNSSPEVKPSPREVPEYYWLTISELMDQENAPSWLKHYTSFLDKSPASGIV